MKRRDEGKVSLVDFMRSIKYAHHKKRQNDHEYPAQLAGFSPRVHADKVSNAEESHLVRSGN